MPGAKHYLCLYQQVNFKGVSVDFFEHQQSTAIFFGLVNKILTEHM